MTKMTLGVAPGPRNLAITWKPEGAVSEPGAAPSHVHRRPCQNARVRRHCVSFGTDWVALDRPWPNKIYDKNGAYGGEADRNIYVTRCLWASSRNAISDRNVRHIVATCAPMFIRVYLSVWTALGLALGYASRVGVAKVLQRLTARAVDTISTPGRHADGGGLYLQVGAKGAKSWLFMFKRDGRQREMGLGSVKDVRLAQARERAAVARQLLAEGRDPIEVRRASEVSPAVPPRAVPTFGEFADSYVAEIEESFSNPKHRAQWRMTLGDCYCGSLRGKPIDEIGTEDILAVLRPIWSNKAETASRLRGRIEQVLNAAKARGLRSGENPALWRGHLDLLLRRRKVIVSHHKAMPYLDLPGFMPTLEALEGMSALALRFTILTAARSGEVLGARWDEIDLEAKVWSVPACRMKMRREHRVPLSESALVVLATVGPMRPANDGGAAFVFAGAKPGKPLSVMSLTMVLRRLNAGVTVHGFRSSFRDWCAEETNYPREVAEAALAHVVGDATERAYRRGDALEKRRQLMEEWAAFCKGSLILESPLSK